MKPDALLKLHSIEDIAQELQHWSYDFTDAEVLSWLRSRGYIVGAAGERYNAPSDFCLEFGWMVEVRRFTYGSGGTRYIELRPKFTQAGWERIMPRLLQYVHNREEERHDFRH